MWSVCASVSVPQSFLRVGYMGTTSVPTYLCLVSGLIGVSA